MGERLSPHGMLDYSIQQRAKYETHYFKKIQKKTTAQDLMRLGF